MAAQAEVKLMMLMMMLIVMLMLMLMAKPLTFLPLMVGRVTDNPK